MSHLHSPSSRGEMVLAELKLLASIPTGPYHEFPAPMTPHKPQHISTSLESERETAHSAPSAPVAVKFPRSRRTLSTTKGRSNGRGLPGSASSGSDATDENSQPSTPNAQKSPLGIARTVRRTISGGLSNILRPFQPSVTREDLNSETMPQQQGSFRKSIKRTVSGNFLRAIKVEESPRRPTVKGGDGRRRTHSTAKKPTATAASTTRTRSSRVRESVCSRNSTISIMEYLAERRRLEEGQDLIEQTLVPLSEYGRNCHLFGCDSLHIWNPDPTSSCAIIHCDCEENERSKEHVHIDEMETVVPFFYKPGNSASTCIISEKDQDFDLDSYPSSIVDRQSMISVDSLASTEKQHYHQQHHHQYQQHYQHDNL